VFWVISVSFNIRNTLPKYCTFLLGHPVYVKILLINILLINKGHILIYLLNAIGLTPGGSSTVHIYTQTIHRTTQNKQYIEQHNNLGDCGPCPFLTSYTLAFALQLRKRHGKTSVRVEV